MRPPDAFLRQVREHITGVRRELDGADVLSSLHDGELVVQDATGSGPAVSVSVQAVVPAGGAFPFSNAVQVTLIP